MKYDVASGTGGTFQFDDAIAFFFENSEAKMAGVEFSHGFDVADVKQNSAKDGFGKTSLALLGHHTARVARKGCDFTGQRCLIGLTGIINLTDCNLSSAFLHEAMPLKLRKAAIDNLPRFRSESG